jgi:hypothetical protein
MLSLAAAVLLGAAGCSDEIVAPDAATQLASVVPAGGAVNVDVGSVIVVEFSHPMMVGMEAYLAVHEGEVTGPVVAGIWAWSADRTRVAFQPASPLKPRTRYTIHIGGGMKDADGRMIGFGDHGGQMGGQWVSSRMMRGGMMGGTNAMMGDGWRHANGTFGMVFSFTTG